MIICAKLDRMFRSALDALKTAEVIKEKGVSLHLIDLGGDVTGNGISKMFFTIVSAVAEAERDRIAQRVLDVKQDQRKRGRHLGGKRPFGFQIDKDGGLVEDEREQAAIRKIVELRKARTPLCAIQEAMAADGHKLSHVAIDRIWKRHGIGE